MHTYTHRGYTKEFIILVQTHTHSHATGPGLVSTSPQMINNREMISITSIDSIISHIREQHIRYRVNLSVKQAKENEEHSLQGEMVEESEDVMEVVDEEEELALRLEEEWEVEWLPSLSSSVVMVVCSLAQ